MLLSSATVTGVDPVSGMAPGRDRFDHTFCAVNRYQAAIMMPEGALMLERCFEAIMDAGK